MKALIWKIVLVCGMMANYSGGNFAPYIRTRSKGESFFDDSGFFFVNKEFGVCKMSYTCSTELTRYVRLTTCINIFPFFPLHSSSKS